jgi:hypothetical protein
MKSYYKRTCFASVDMEASRFASADMEASRFASVDMEASFHYLTQFVQKYARTFIAKSVICKEATFDSGASVASTYYAELCLCSTHGEF